MTTTTPEDRTAGTDTRAMLAALAASGRPELDALADRIGDALDRGPSGTMRAWFTTHQGRKITTVQVGFGARIWSPTGRTVDTVRAGSVTLAGSRREFAGLSVIGASGRALVVTSTDPDDPDARETVAYLVE